MEDKFPLIDKYLLGRLSNEERLLFDKASKETAFAKELEYRTQVYKASKIVGREHLKDQLSKIKTPPSRKTITINIWRSIAAIGVILIAAYFLLKPSQELHFSEQLYAAHYEPLPNKMVLVKRGETKSIDSLTMAMNSYNSKAYDEAITLVELLEYKYPEINIYKGAIAMELENFNSAIKVFKSIAQDHNHKFKIDAEFYLAMSYLKVGKEKEANKIFQSLALVDSYYGNIAKRIIQEWKK